MTFDALIPLASDSPGIFPAQSQANFTRLRDIIAADHQFNNSAAANDGYHNLIHMTPQAPTGALAGVGRLYVKDVAGVIQLFYRDSAGTEYEITPESTISPTLIYSSQNIAAATTVTVFADPGYKYTAIATAYLNGLQNFSSASCVLSAAIGNRVTFAQSLGAFPTFSYFGGDLRVTNNAGIAQVVWWSIMLNRQP